MTRLGRLALPRAMAAVTLILGILAFSSAKAAPDASLVMDARTGQVLHAENADARIHPASLTKMMTLYIAFQAIERGDMRLTSEITVTKVAAQQPPSRLGLREGQKIQLQHLIRAAAIKSANDAATAIGVGIAGSEAAFAERMNATARAMGMNNTRFRNMHGLTTEGHYSTARDMTILGRHLIYDFPQYYNIFSRRDADAGIAQVRTTNARFLDNYEGADGIKTGYTQAAGYNLTASAERGNTRIIATVMGANSGADRHSKVTRLLNLGFERAPNRARLSKPEPAPYFRTTEGSRSQAPANSAPTESLRPLGAPPPSTAPDPAIPHNNFDMNALIAAVSATTMPTVPADAAAPSAVSEALRPAMRPTQTTASTQQNAEITLAAAAPPPSLPPSAEVSDLPIMTVLRPTARPGSVTSGAIAFAEAAPAPAVSFGSTAAQPETLSMLGGSTDAPAARPSGAIIMTAAEIAPQATSAAQVEVVTRLSTSGNEGFGINIGRFNSTYAAERELMRVAMMETSVLSESRRTVLQTARGYDATFMGLNRDSAELACQRLQARGQMCFMING